MAQLPAKAEMASTNSGDSAKRSISSDEFVTLLVRCERRVRAFVSTLHPHSHDVDEIVQESCLIAWKKFQSFTYSKSTPDEEFVRWLCMISRYELSNFRRKRGHAELVFDDALLDKLVDQGKRMIRPRFDCSQVGCLSEG
jgi:RNA polymerase sigma-70 factor (ECF subfamily)